ncbi:MAG: hypothetical protein VW226_10360 [Rhodospirillaceae bacterium]
MNMIDYFANNALLAPIPVALLIAGGLTLLIIFFWLIPLERKINRLKEEMATLGRSALPQAPTMDTIQSKNENPTRFTQLYQQTLQQGDTKTSEGANLPLEPEEKPGTMNRVNEGIAQQSLKRRIRRLEKS